MTVGIIWYLKHLSSVLTKTKQVYVIARSVSDVAISNKISFYGKHEIATACKAGFAMTTLPFFIELTQISTFKGVDNTRKTSLRANGVSVAISNKISFYGKYEIATACKAGFAMTAAVKK